MSVVSRGGEEFTKSSTPRSKADGLQSSRHETVTEAKARGKNPGCLRYAFYFPMENPLFGRFFMVYLYLFGGLAQIQVNDAYLISLFSKG